MFAILAEDLSDAESLSHIVKKYFDDESLTIKRKGYDGCGELCKKGARDIRAFRRLGTQRFIICHDADQHPPEQIHQKVFDTIVKPADALSISCITVPVRAIEAWLIADESAINRVIPSFRFNGNDQPESIADPKKWLIRKSEAANVRPPYLPTIRNEKVARHLRLDVVAKKCPSFKAFLEGLRRMLETRG